MDAAIRQPVQFPNFHDGIRCLVTGGCGFIGRHVARKLSTLGASVTTFDRRAVKEINPEIDHHVVGDIRDKELVADLCGNTEFVFHLCGLLGTHELFAHPEEAIDVNINGALNILKAVRESRTRPRIFLPAKPNEWNSIYSVTSQAVEKLGHTYRDVYGLDVRILRIRNVYGPGQSLHPIRKFVPYCISRALRNESVEIFGDGTQEVELLYISDVTDLLIRYMFFNGDVRQTHELKPESTTSAISLAKRIVALARSRSPLIHVPMRLGEQPGTQFSSACPVSALFANMTSPVTEAEGLELTLKWYRQLPLAAHTAERDFYETTTAYP